MDFEQTPLVLSSTFYFGPKIAFSIYGSEETCLTTYCTMDNAAPDGDIFWISFAVVILRWWKVVRWVQFYWITGYLSKIEWRLQKKSFIWPSSTLKSIDLDYRSSLSVAQLVRFWFKSLQSLTANERQFLQGNLFLLAAHTPIRWPAHSDHSCLHHH